MYENYIYKYTTKIKALANIEFKIYKFGGICNDISNYGGKNKKPEKKV